MPPRPRNWLLYEIGYRLSAAVLWLFFSLRVAGRKNVPRHGPVLLVANHESFLDPPLVGVAAYPRKPNYVARKTLFRNRLFGWILHSVGAFPIDQEGVGLEGIKASLALLKEGQAVLIFPEGSRTPDGQMHAFLPGVVLLVRRAKVPVIPVGVAGCFEAWPIHGKPHPAPQFWPARRGAVACVIGKPIPPADLLALKPPEMLARLQREVAVLRERAEKLRRKEKE
jgi:1-acyl-sn-glycerol-3-phosphate acyltransferase